MATVLIVDECFRNRQCLAALLGERGHRVFNALSGADGLESIRKETPDLIVADICFPTLDGCRFVRRLRTDFGEFKIPVVFLIPSLQQAEAIALARACGIENVLTKHSDSETALRVLGDALADARAPQVKDAKKNLECPHRPFAAESPGDINKRAGPVCGICLGLADIFPLKQALENFCREARAQLCSRSVALGIVNSDRSGLEQICFSGIRDAAASQLARMPPSQGVLGALFVESNTIRLQGLPGDPAAIGLPHAHPPVHSFLAAPIPNGAGAIGWLYFVDKIGRDQFSSDEEKFAALLASQCGQIIANNRLFSGAMNRPAKLEHENGVSRRRMEAAHMESEHLFRSAFEHTQVGMALTSVDHQFVRVNFAFGRLLGYSEQELLALSPRDVLTPDHYAQNIEHCEKLLAGENNAFHLELQFVHKDGHLLWGSNSVSLSRDGNGQPVYFVSQLQDVSERKNLEGQILHAQHRLQQVVASSPAVLFTMPVSGERLYPDWLSENVRDMFGFEPEEALQPDWWNERIHPEDLHRVQTQTFELYSRGSVAEEYRFRHQDGRYRWIHSELRLQRDTSGRPVEIVGSWTDITDRKHLEEQFRQSQKMEAIGRLAGGVAHDFNNLLTIISGYTEILGEHFRPGDPLRGYIEQIQKATERATSLSRQMLTFSRKQMLLASVLDLNDLLREMQKMLSRLIGEDIELSFVAQPGLWRVKVDPGQLEQVVMNLVVNARDAMPQGGRLTIETANVELDQSYAGNHLQCRPGEHVLLAVSDTGCGMDDATKARLFEPFFTTKGPDKGTGLGLATVYGIVKQSGGGIHVYSEVGIGTTFKIHLPRAGEELTKSGFRAKQSPALRGVETVLLVEDEDGVRTLARVILERHGYTVLEACNGGEALLRCRDHSGIIHLTVTDVVMPNMSGGQLAKHLVDIRPEMKVLYLSGYTEEAVLHHGVIDADAPFLHKPFTSEALARKVRDVLDGKASTALPNPDDPNPYVA